MKEKYFLSPEASDIYSSYADSFKSKTDISIEEMEELCGEDLVLKELLDDVLDMCLRYTQTVLDMSNELSKSEDGVKSEDYREISAIRGRIHDTTIESINIFARALKNKGKRFDWVDAFNGERSAYGRFAILITLSRIKEQKN